MKCVLWALCNSKGQITRTRDSLGGYDGRMRLYCKREIAERWRKDFFPHLIVQRITCVGRKPKAKRSS